MRILILNWRDIKNPSSGGAEILTHELASRLVKRGHTVTQISSYFKNAKSREKLDGVNIIRKGNPDARALFNSVHFNAYKIYKKDFQGNIDIVVDEVHGIPFFSTFYVKEKKVVLICEIADELWKIAVRFPFSSLGRLIEKVYPFFYKNIPILTISESSKKEIINNGFSKSQVEVIPMGSNSRIVNVLPEKEVNETLIFVSRLSKTKGVTDAIQAVKILKKKYPNIMLWIVGRGSDSFKNEILELVANLNLLENIKFFDFVTERKKEELLTRSHILVAPSVKEGWGLTVHEAGARGTPSVVYNVPGLRDIVKNNYNGLVCSENTPESLANNLDKLLKDKLLYKRLQRGAIQERKKHTWDSTVDKFLEFTSVRE